LFDILFALSFFGRIPRYAGVGLSAPIAAQFPLQSLARLTRETIAYALLKAKDKAAGGLARMLRELLAIPISKSGCESRWQPLAQRSATDRWFRVVRASEFVSE
jgi:hypothetical protein